MICISVTPTSRKLAKADILNATRHCDLVEVCLDHLAKEPDVGDLIKGFNKPILVSCRRQTDGGQWTGSEDDRIKLLRQAIVAGPEYIELELDAAAGIPRFGKTKRVISYTSYKPLGNVDEIFRDAAAVHADVVKFTWPTPALDAAWPLLAAVTKKRELPVVGMGVGAGSTTFSLLSLRFGSPWVYAALEKGMEAHDGQATVWDLDEVYDWIAIGPKTRFVGIVETGGHRNEALRQAVATLNAGFRALGLAYRCLPLELGKLDKLGQMLDILKINALIVGAEWSETLLEVTGRREEAVQKSHFTDLLLKQPEGWHAYNFIWRNALRVLEHTLAAKSGAAPGQTPAQDRPLDRRNVLLVGANNLAQALAFGIQRRKGVLSVTSPRDDDAREIAQAWNVRHVPFASVYDTLADVVVIADPSIVCGHRKTELNPSFLRPTMTVLDLCRMPDETEFLREARERGCTIVEPSGVYREQLAAQFKAVTGQELPAASANP
ncbi:MAG TPA: type I 3-dehydroquinate dehydratase [Planctomycetaceae bacterium]|nr:type I 3-dehydroquinate dehydratase [Planctomycetaceae bacterium]